MSRKPYIQELPKASWWLRQGRYKRYMLREVTCIFIAAYTALLLIGLKRLAEGQVAYEAFLEALKSPLSILFHLAVLALTVYHTTSWFNVTPKAMPVQVGEHKLPGSVIVGAHYGGWVVVSLIVLILAGVF